VSPPDRYFQLFQAIAHKFHHAEQENDSELLAIYEIFQGIWVSGWTLVISGIPTAQGLLKST